MPREFKKGNIGTNYNDTKQNQEEFFIATIHTTLVAYNSTVDI